MIEIYNVQPVNKGSLLATCDVYIKPWDMELNEVKIFEKGANRWLGMPARQFTNQAGEVKYVELITFRKDATKNRFRSHILEAVDSFLKSNPEMKEEPLIREDADLPF